LKVDCKILFLNKHFFGTLGIHATKTSKPNADHTYVPQLESTDKDEEDDGDDDEDEEDTDERPICRFGAGCFRKNPKHFEVNRSRE